MSRLWLRGIEVIRWFRCNLNLISRWNAANNTLLSAGSRFTIFPVLRYSKYSLEKLLIPAGTSVLIAAEERKGGGGVAGEGGREGGRRGSEIGVRFNSNESRNCFTQSAIICLKILPRIRERVRRLIRYEYYSMCIAERVWLRADRAIIDSMPMRSFCLCNKTTWARGSACVLAALVPPPNQRSGCVSGEILLVFVNIEDSRLRKRRREWWRYNGN